MKKRYIKDISDRIEVVIYVGLGLLCSLAIVWQVISAG